MQLTKIYAATNNKFLFNVLMVKKVVFKLKVNIYNKNKQTKSTYIYKHANNIFLLLARVISVVFAQLHKLNLELVGHFRNNKS